MRKSSSGKNIHEFREVTPFYMQHSYSHFRYDPTYDSPKQGTPNKSDQNHSKHDRKLSSQERKMSQLHRKLFDNDKKSSIAGRKVTQERRLSDEDVKQSRENAPCFDQMGRRNSWTNEPSAFKKFSSNLLSEKRCSSLDENIQKWHLRSATFSDTTSSDATEIESVGDKNKLPPIKQKSNKIFTIGDADEEIDGPRKVSTLKTHSLQDPLKAKRLKELVQDRLGKGYTIADLANDPSFEDVLDVCHEDVYFPAYEIGEELKLENYQALRKCKYLRVSETNIASLKEAALKFLNEEEI